MNFDVINIKAVYSAIIFAIETIIGEMFFREKDAARYIQNPHAWIMRENHAADCRAGAGGRLRPAITPERYAGHYLSQGERAPKIDFDVRADGGQMFARVDQQPLLPVFPVAGKADRFAWDVVVAELQFERDAGGAVTAWGCIRKAGYARCGLKKRPARQARRARPSSAVAREEACRTRRAGSDPRARWITM